MYYYTTIGFEGKDIFEGKVFLLLATTNMHEVGEFYFVVISWKNALSHI